MLGVQDAAGTVHSITAAPSSSTSIALRMLRPGHTVAVTGLKVLEHQAGSSGDACACTWAEVRLLCSKKLEVG
jgi:hypothetical protein